MKVLHVLPSISPLLGGPTQVALNLVKNLRTQGVETEIATTNHHGREKLDVPLEQRIVYAQVPTWFFPTFGPPLKEFIFSPIFTGWLWSNLKNYDLIDIHYLFSYAPTCAGIIARHKKIPYTVHTMGQLSPWALEQSRWKKQLYISLIERHHLNSATAIHCTSSQSAQDADDFGIKTPKVVIPLGVNPPSHILGAKHQLRQRFNIPTDTPVILFMSRIYPVKRLDLLIQVLGELKSPQQPFHLIVAGSGDARYVESLHQLIAQHQLQSQTTFAGFVTGEDKDLLLQGSDFFALPSYSENFGIALAEAMVVGIPVITTPGVHISSDIVQAKAGIIVDDATQLKIAISQLLQSPQLRKELGDNGKRLAFSKYAWPAIAKSFAALYSLILDEKSIPPIYFP